MNAICGDCFANAAIRSCFVDTMVEFRCIRRVSQERFHDPTPRFPPLAPAGSRSPASAVLSRRYDFLPPIPPHFVAFAWRYLSVHSFFSLPGGRVRRRGLELVTRYLRPGFSLRKRQDLPSSWGTPIVRLHMFSRRRQDCWHQTITVQQHGPWYREQQRLPRKVFRRSIAWLSDSLSTLRSAGYPDPTQDSLPAAGQALPDGLSTRRVPMKGFRAVSYISSPFPKLLAAIRSTEASYAGFRSSGCSPRFCSVAETLAPPFLILHPPRRWSKETRRSGFFEMKSLSDRRGKENGRLIYPTVPLFGGRKPIHGQPTFQRSRRRIG